MVRKLITLIPVRVRIKKNITYEVVWVDGFPSDPKQVGECRPETKQIVLKKNQSPTETFKTFIHEILHAIERETKDLDLTEKQVLKLEEGIYQVLRLNKVLELLFKGWYS